MLSLDYSASEGESVSHVRILFLFTYAKIAYVSVRTYLSENRIRTLRIPEPCYKCPAVDNY